MHYRHTDEEKTKKRAEKNYDPTGGGEKLWRARELIETANKEN